MVRAQAGLISILRLSGMAPIFLVFGSAPAGAGQVARPATEGWSFRPDALTKGITERATTRPLHQRSVQRFWSRLWQGSPPCPTRPDASEAVSRSRLRKKRPSKHGRGTTGSTAGLLVSGKHHPVNGELPPDTRAKPPKSSLPPAPSKPPPRTPGTPPRHPPRARAGRSRTPGTAPGAAPPAAAPTRWSQPPPSRRPPRGGC